MTRQFVSIFADPSLEYPDGDDYYSPHERFPEYRYACTTSSANPIYSAVRQVFYQAGLDEKHYGTRHWNPLGEYIQRGSRVFVLCNFVYHRNPYENQSTFLAKCIHASVLRPILDYVLIALGPDGRVMFGNAPLQSCDWPKVLQNTGASRVLEFYRKEGLDVEARDLRSHVVQQDILGRLTKVEERDARDDAVTVDLGSQSLLREFDHHPVGFRVADYDPRLTQSYHAAGRHIYLINRAVLEADVILSLSKLKTHEKVGVTCGLKGFVGVVCQKECLAHHRVGAPSDGGDEYPNHSLPARMVAGFHDWVQTQNPPRPGINLLRVIDRNGRRLFRWAGGILAGAWHGNDTAWRMALDLARILHYADACGNLHDTKQRRHLSFIDGIVAGEGEGPLSPTPVKSGSLIFSDNVAVGDWAACRLMGFEPSSIPLIREAFRAMPYALCQSSPTAYTSDANGQRIAPDEISRLLSHQFLPPRGWQRDSKKPLCS